MPEKKLKKLLEDLRDGRTTVDTVMERIGTLGFEDLGFVKIDHHRRFRCGVPEVIFCEGKSPHQVQRISEKIIEAGSDLLATRAEEEHFEAVLEVCPRAEYHEVARCIVYHHEEQSDTGKILVITAGTSDLPVAREAEVTARALGNNVDLISDVGVAGIHRLLKYTERLQNANVLVVVAGMEGALASVVGGLVARPVIAVPTSVGYGASFQGLAPLLTMLNSCAAGVSVVNIDNGFGGGYMASLINKLAADGREPDDTASSETS